MDEETEGTPTPGETTVRRPETESGSLTIDCASCAHRDTPVCEECVVTFIVGRDPDDAVVVDSEEVRAVRLLAHAGLVPRVRHESRAG